MMKLLPVALGFILISCHARTIETDDLSYVDLFARTKFEKLLEDVKKMLKTGNETWGLPPLDPFIADQLPIKIDEEIAKLDALLTNVDVRGLSEYDVISGDFRVIGLKLVMSLSWPLVYAKTDYAIEGTVASEFPIYGKGNINLSAQGFDFSIEISFGVNGKYLKVNGIESKFSLKTLQFKATGLYDDEEISELLSAIISDLVPQMINDYPEEITSRLHPILHEKLDAFLATKTILELIEIFT